MSNDSALLRRYSSQGDEAAFAELVRAHLDLVYTAAVRRMEGDVHAAGEVTQLVFISMARNANKLARHPVLNAWLHASTRNAASNYRRDAKRRERQKQEMMAMEDLTTREPEAAHWLRIRNVLDEIVDELSEAERRSIILRFFEGQSYPTIADLIGGSEDAARMRVARALDKLRERLARRGIASSAALLGGLLSGNAVSASPQGLASVICASTAAATATTQATVIFFMSTTKALVSVGAVVLLVGFGISRFRHAATVHEIRATNPSALRTSVSASVSDADRRAAELSAVVQTRTLSAATLEAEDKISALREVLKQLPEQSIPELKLATDADWHMAVDAKLENADDYRQALSRLRSAVEHRFAKMAQPALQTYLKANHGAFPTDVSQLQPFADGSVDLEMLKRYRIAPASEVSNVRVGGEQIITQDHLIDTEYDHHSVIGPVGFGSTSSHLSELGKKAWRAPK